MINVGFALVVCRTGKYPVTISIYLVEFKFASVHLLTGFYSVVPNRRTSAIERHLVVGVGSLLTFNGPSRGRPTTVLRQDIQFVL